VFEGGAYIRHPPPEVLVRVTFLPLFSSRGARLRRSRATTIGHLLCLSALQSPSNLTLNRPRSDLLNPVPISLSTFRTIKAEMNLNGRFFVGWRGSMCVLVSITSALDCGDCVTTIE
jgi:hypothetical protein